MIVKPSTKADECAALSAFMAAAEVETLLGRARKQAHTRRRGLEGERATAHILDRHFHDAPNHALLHDLRLPDGIGGFAQFDHVILSRLSRTAAIVEVKNYSGRLSKNDHNEWLVWYKGRHRPQDIPNPLAQGRRQREVLRTRLALNHHDAAFEKMGAYVTIPPYCSIDRSKVGHDEPIYKADNFISAWSEFGRVTGFGKLFSTGVSAAVLRKIAEQLAASHQPDPRSFEEQIGLRASCAVDAAVDDCGAVEIADVVSPIVETPTSATAPTEEAADQPAAPSIYLTEDPGTVDESAPPPQAGRTKASQKSELVPGIYERLLPDGRVAFLADADESARDRLRQTCRGLAKWNPRFSNWLCDAEQASLIRAALLAPIREQAEVSHAAP